MLLLRNDAKCPDEIERCNIRHAVYPKPMIPHSFCSPELAAHITYEKFAKAIPLYRQEYDESGTTMGVHPERCEKSGTYTDFDIFDAARNLMQNSKTVPFICGTVCFVIDPSSVSSSRNCSTPIY